MKTTTKRLLKLETPKDWIPSKSQTKDANTLLLSAVDCSKYLLKKSLSSASGTIRYYLKKNLGVRTYNRLTFHVQKDADGKEVAVRIRRIAEQK